MTKLVAVADFSAKAHLVHMHWAQLIQCGDPKEEQAEQHLIFGCLLCTAMRQMANPHSCQDARCKNFTPGTPRNMIIIIVIIFFPVRLGPCRV